MIENYELTVDRWLEADDKVIRYDGDVPRSTPEAIERGQMPTLRCNASSMITRKEAKHWQYVASFLGFALP